MGRRGKRIELREVIDLGSQPSREGRLKVKTSTYYVGVAGKLRAAPLQRDHIASATAISTITHTA